MWLVNIWPYLVVDIIQKFIWEGVELLIVCYDISDNCVSNIESHLFHSFEFDQHRQGKTHQKSDDDIFTPSFTVRSENRRF
jgi:hypothetical protein